MKFAERERVKEIRVPDRGKYLIKLNIFCKPRLLPLTIVL